MLTGFFKNNENRNILVNEATLLPIIHLLIAIQLQIIFQLYMLWCHKSETLVGIEHTTLMPIE